MHEEFIFHCAFCSNTLCLDAGMENGIEAKISIDTDPAIDGNAPLVPRRNENT